MVLRRGTSSIVQFVIVALLTSGMLLYSEKLLTAQWQFGIFHFWIGFFLLVASEYMPVPTGKAKYHFRTVIQFPIIILLGLFPLLVAQIAILIAHYLVRFVLLRTARWNFFNFLTATLPPTIAATVLQISIHAQSASHLSFLLVVMGALMSYLLTSYIIYQVIPFRSVVHPFKTISGMYLMMLGIDSLMALGALTEQSLSGPWVELAIAFQFIAILATIRLFMDSSIRRFRLVAVTKLMSDLTEHIYLDKLVPDLFAGLAKMLCMDGAVLWVYGDDKQLHPMFIHDVSQDKAWETHFAAKFGCIASGVGVEGFSFSSRETVRIDSNKQPNQYLDSGMKDHYNSALVSPILVEKETYGVLAIYHQTGIKIYGRRDAELLTLVSSQLGSLLVYLIRYEESRRQSNLDELTGVYNYRFFDAAVDHQIHLSQATSQPLTLLILDIDHFKDVNDTYGHLAGNRVLIQLSQLLREMVRETDVLARYGGEEFTILLPGLGSEESSAVAERIRERIENTSFPIEETSLESSDIEELIRSANINLRVTVSIGLATYPTGADSAMSLLRHADRAMYVGAKQSGRNKVSTYA